MTGNADDLQKEKDQSPDQQKAGARRIGVILLTLQLAAASVTLILRAIKITQTTNGNPEGIVIVSFGFATLIAVVDLIWLIFYLRVNHPIPQHAATRRMISQTLSRIQAIAAWLIYHTAALPFVFLVDRAREISVQTYLLIQLALLIMGLIPILSMILVDQFLNRKMISR
jgi:hypothetical protein